jgi:hypothetical protein
MTAVHTTPAARPARSDGRLGERLQRMHRQWLQELRATVEEAKAKDSGIWPRWRFIRYVDTVFSGRFDRERRAIESLSPTIDPGQVDHLWVAGELVTMLRWQLGQHVGLCHRPTEFAVITAKLLRAVEYWFAAVEELGGLLRWDDVPAQVCQNLASLDIETAPNWSELPVSLVTSL